MASWRRRLAHNPIPLLLESPSKPVSYFARRDLLGEDPGPVKRLWGLPEAGRILRKQMRNGGWKYSLPRAAVRSAEDYNQIETFRNLGFLVEKFGFVRRHSALRGAAEYLLARQTPAGDIRGIYGTQYTPNYTAAILELLIKAGYGRDPRIGRGLRWLLSMRQADGGWAIPFRTVASEKLGKSFMRSRVLEPDRARPFSHLVTGVVLRAFAAAGTYGRNRDVRAAGAMLAARFFKADSYVDRKAPSFWTGFRFPFWFTDLLSALDTLSRLGFSPDEAEIRKGLDWFAARQRKDGGWTLKLQGGADKALPYWLDLTVCRVFKRFYGG
jgi:hypothetical protein